LKRSCNLYFGGVIWNGLQEVKSVAFLKKFKEDYVIKPCMDTTACKKLPSCCPHFKLWIEEWRMWFL